MSQHIEKIAENLYTLTARKMKPLVVAIDENNNFVSHFGELDDYKLPQFEIGQSCAESLPFLIGLEEEAYVALPLVNFNDDNVCSVNIIRINSNRFVVLLEAVDEHEREQLATQESNETKLLYRKLQHLTEKLEVANSTKSRFISGMSHELRTPISSILGYSNLLAKKYSDTDEEYKYVKAIEGNTQYLLSLIDNLLEHAQLEADKIIINIAPFALNDLIANIGIMFGAQAEKSNIVFNLDTDDSLPKVIYSDQIRLQQVLINIIGNAFKFTEKGSITVKFSWQDEKLNVVVKDTGPGISAENQSSIFVPYKRFNAVDKKGAGLGLSISATIANKLNGRIDVESKLGEGSKFRLVVKAKSANAIRNNRHDDPQPSGKKRVLIVEDDSFLIELLKIYLHDSGFSTLTAVNGKEALDVCAQEEVELVLLDMQLPILNGVEVAQELRASKFKAPIIAMTASTNNEDKINAIEAGCNDFLSKPIKPESLLNAISTIFTEHA